MRSANLTETLIKSIKNLNWRLYASLVLMGLVPTVYTTVRTFFLGQLPGEWAYSIAGQLSWVNLLYEILDEAIILPLFFCLGPPREDPAEFSNRVRTGLFASGAIYLAFAAVITAFAKPLLMLMAADPGIIESSASYIRIEAAANVFGILFRFLLVAVVAAGKDRAVCAITGLRLLLSVVLDTFLISQLPFSLNLGVNGIGCSNIIVNALLALLAWKLLKREGYIQSRGPRSFAWMRDFAKIGGISGLESFVRNIAYMLMVSRMINMVGEQGTYWVANNFIWGWLLLPALQLGELIKQETSESKEKIRTNTPGYFAVTAVIVAVWILTIPLYKPFMSKVLGFSDADKLFRLVMILLVPYIAFAFQNIFDATFYGRGETRYMLFESVVTNSVYYGGAFAAYMLGLWTPTLTGVALMFGIGNIFDAAVSALAYRHFRKRI